MKKFFSMLMSAAFLCLLCGCNFGNPADSENISETSPAPETTAATESETTKAEAASSSEETSAVTEETIFSISDDQESLSNMILNSAGGVTHYNTNTDEVCPLIFDDLDGDGKNELIAIYGRKYDLSDQKNYASGEIWFADDNKATELSSVGNYSGLCLDDIDESIEIKNIDSHAVIIVKENSMGWKDCKRSYLYEIKNGTVNELNISGKFGRITDIGGGVYSAVKFDNDATPFYSGETTWKNYWFYFENGEFKEYIGENITKADFMKYSGGKAVLDGISADGGEVTDIFYRKNDVVNVNYTIIKDGTTYNKFFSFDVSGGSCKEIESIYGGDTNNYGVYLPSVLDPKLGLPEEQLTLYKLIEETAELEKKDYEVIYPIFGDFDKDGKNEMIAVYLYNDPSQTQKYSGVWFASENTATELVASFTALIPAEWSPPKIVTSRGNTFLKMENCSFATSSYSCYFIIKNSTARAYDELNLGQGVYPYGEHGDFTVVHDAYDSSYLHEADGSTSFAGGHTWKTYWYYNIGNKSKSYKGVNISQKEFLKYEGAKEILDEMDSNEYEIESILKRGNGIININYSEIYTPDHPDGSYTIGYRNKTLKYRGGKVIDITEKSGYDDGGLYYEYDGKEPIPDFEIFSGMIYDAAEGNENSALLDRFCGDIDNDGKNELYAYYGTEEKFELWFADENGAEKSDKPYELITLDGDVLLKKPDSDDSDIYEYFIIRNGKSVPVNAFDAKNMSQTENGDFSGFITAADAVSDESEETSKEYWFYYQNSKFNEYPAEIITEDELLEYKGARAFLDEISSMGGEVVNIIRRDNGIININYDAHMQNVTMHYYLTLKIDDKDRVEDITPRNSDGTLNNKGYYLPKLKK